jgi:hypothetical protein
MNVNDRDKDLESLARGVFDESVERLDGATRSRLTQARHAALAELERPRFRLASWVPAGAMAGATVLAVMLWTQPGPGVAPEPTLAAVPADDFEMLTMGEDLDLLDEDVGFYAWVATAGMANEQG